LIHCGLAGVVCFIVATITYAQLILTSVPAPKDVAGHIGYGDVKEQLHPFEVRHTVIITLNADPVKNPTVLPGL
jgi:hypothetical protein